LDTHVLVKCFDGETYYMVYFDHSSNIVYILYSWRYHVISIYFLTLERDGPRMWGVLPSIRERWLRNWLVIRISGSDIVSYHIKFFWWVKKWFPIFHNRYPMHSHIPTLCDKLWPWVLSIYSLVDTRCNVLWSADMLYLTFFVEECSLLDWL
jgi:hypothetical protein